MCGCKCSESCIPPLTVAMQAARPIPCTTGTPPGHFTPAARCTQIHTHMHTDIYVHVHACTTEIRTQSTHVHKTYTYTYKDTETHNTHTHTNTRTHAHTHTEIHSCRRDPTTIVALCHTASRRSVLGTSTPREHQESPA
jgi:hypothetical protein